MTVEDFVERLDHMGYGHLMVGLCERCDLLKVSGSDNDVARALAERNSLPLCWVSRGAPLCYPTNKGNMLRESGARRTSSTTGGGGAWSRNYSR